MLQQSKPTQQLDTIVSKFVAKLESGDIKEWKKGWDIGLPQNYASSTSYNGFNALSLLMECSDKGYSDNRWLTFNQTKLLGGSIIKGESGVPIVFYEKLPKETITLQEKMQTIKEAIEALHISPNFEFQLLEEKGHITVSATVCERRCTNLDIWNKYKSDFGKINTFLESLDGVIKTSPFSYEKAKEYDEYAQMNEGSAYSEYEQSITVSCDVAKPRSEDSFILKSFTLFNVSQTQGIDITPRIKQSGTPNENAEFYFNHTGALVEHKGNKACYTPATDVITLPPHQTFFSINEYYATFAHELSHWSGATQRLNRFGVDDDVSSESYAMEELVAELSSAFICSSLHIPDVYENNASYIDHWIKALKEKPSLLYSIASKATKAKEFIDTQVEYHKTYSVKGASSLDNIIYAMEQDQTLYEENPPTVSIPTTPPSHTPSVRR